MFVKAHVVWLSILILLVTQTSVVYESSSCWCCEILASPPLLMLLLLCLWLLLSFVLSWILLSLSSVLSWLSLLSSLLLLNPKSDDYPGVCMVKKSLLVLGESREALFCSKTKSCLMGIENQVFLTLHLKLRIFEMMINMAINLRLIATIRRCFFMADSWDVWMIWWSCPWKDSVQSLQIEIVKPSHFSMLSSFQVESGEVLSEDIARTAVAGSQRAVVGGVVQQLPAPPTSQANLGCTNPWMWDPQLVNGWSRQLCLNVACPKRWRLGLTHRARIWQSKGLTNLRNTLFQS